MKKIFSHFFVGLMLLPLLSLVAQSTRGSLSGHYSSSHGTFVIGINNNVISGTYEFLKDYDAQVHTYMTQYSFSIYGKSIDGKTFNIVAVPDPFPEARVKGTIVLSENGLKIKLEKSSKLDIDVDATRESEDCFFPLVTKASYESVTCIRSPKASIFNYDGKVFVPRKGYLVKGDRVYVLNQSVGSYKKLIYKSDKTGKTTEYWILDSDIYPADPDTWK